MKAYCENGKLIIDGEGEEVTIEKMVGPLVTSESNIVLKDFRFNFNGCCDAISFKTEERIVKAEFVANCALCPVCGKGHPLPFCEDTNKVISDLRRQLADCQKELTKANAK